MTREARLMSGIILITVATIQYGGYFLIISKHFLNLANAVGKLSRASPKATRRQAGTS